MSTQNLMQVQMSGEGVIGRRSFLRTITAGAIATGALGFKDAVTAAAPELRKKGMSCILVFLNGAPSQFETWDPKPGHANGGPTKAIDSAVAGIKVAEHWPNVAKGMKDFLVLRSMTNREGEHQRATYQMHTGYVPAGGIKHPTLGAVVASEIAPRDFDLPHFVSIGGRGAALGSSFLGMKFAPFVVPNAERMPANVALPAGINEKRFTRRTALADDLQADYADAGGKKLVEDHAALAASASKMVLSPRVKAFDLSSEKDAVRKTYGRTAVGQGCLLARRLVEAGVTFVEIGNGGWDTHQDNFTRHKTLSAPVDAGVAAMVADLRERGLLEKTLVVVMGEFGRTPRINGNTGRDHWPRCFNVLLAGGGIKGGKVVGSTDAGGTGVKERPVTVADLFVSFCQSLKINPRKENLSTEGRPLKIVDGGKVVKELFS
jgi:hypothetical protein